MARCKGCIHENVCNREVGYGYSVCPHYINSADVVPKSEYDAVVSAVDNSTQQFLKLHDDYQEAKREVEKLEQDVTRLVQEKDALIKNYAECMKDNAREIFEKIEDEILGAIKSNVKAIDDRQTEINAYEDSFIVRCYGKIDALRGIDGFIEELKEKYNAE